jgi:hypothetical protein
VCPDDASTDADETLHGAYTPPTVAFDAERTSRIDVPVAGRPTSRLALIVLAVAAAGFLVGIAVASVVPRSHDEPALVSESVGPSGGVVRFDGGEVRVPSGALAEQTTIAVYRSVVDRRVRIDPGGKADPIVFEPGRLVAYRFQPDDITFAQPVQIAFRLPAGAENGTVFARGSRGGIVLLEGQIDADRGTATTVVRDFRFGGAAS